MTSAAIIPKREIVYRHAVIVRVTHWVNALCLLVLLMSGLQIFNAHSTLYFGSKSDPDRAVLSMQAVQRQDGSYAGVTTIGSTAFDTTGVLGLSREGGELVGARLSRLDDAAELSRSCDRPALALLLRLAVRHQRARLSRLLGLLSGHVRRDLVPARRRSCATCRKSIVEHLRLRFPKGEAAKRYNVLQKLAYLGVIFVLLPLIDPDRPDHVAGARRGRSRGCSTSSAAGSRRARSTSSARRGIVLFVVVHVAMVLVSGVWNNLRSMITGRYAIDAGRPPPDDMRHDARRDASRRRFLLRGAAAGRRGCCSAAATALASAVVPRGARHAPRR